MQNSGGLRSEYRTYERQKCFVGHSRGAEWRDDILGACAEVLPRFGLEPWYAADHFDPTKPLRDKVVELIANARYGIYDLSSWQDISGEWHLPRNVLIELGMAIVLNRPTLLLCHTSNKALPLPACLQGVDLVEFAGETTLKKALQQRLPQWFDVPPDRDWLNRFCIFGNRVCGFREEHPRARQWGHETLRCHVCDGLDRAHSCCQKAELEEIRGAFEGIFNRYSDLRFDYLEDLALVDGYQFLLCGHCQAVRSTPFAVYRILPHSPAEVFIAIGMSIALETLFEYDIPKVLLVRQEQDLPSLLRGYEVVEAVSSSEVKRKLKAFVPAVMQKVRETAWKPRPLPFIEVARIADMPPQAIAQPEQGEHPPLQIPRRLDSFVDREHELRFVLEPMAMGTDGSVIAIAGPAGIGKTTFAIEAAWRLYESGRFPDGVLWANRPTENMEATMDSWITLLGDKPLPDLRAKATQLQQLVVKKRLLLVLDDVRDDESLRLLIPILQECSALITTREAGLLTSPEFVTRGKVLALAPFDFEVAELMVRLAAQRHGLKDEIPREAIERLVEATQGLPLAMEWTIASIAQTGATIEAVLERLEGQDQAEYVMDFAFENAYQTLSDEEQRAFHALGILEEPFSTELAASVVGLDQETTIRLLERLMALYLIQLSVEEGSYTQHAVVRYYAVSKLRDAGEWDTVNTKYQAYQTNTLRKSLLPLLVDFEGALRELVDRALQSRYGREWSTRLEVSRYPDRLSLGQLLNLVSEQRDILEPLFATSGAYGMLVTTAVEITTTRNALAHGVPGPDVAEMQRVQELVERLLPMIREAQSAIQLEADLSSPYCFVIMPFASEFEPVFESIRAAVENSTQYRCLRADSIVSGDSIARKVQRLIDGAVLVIADISGRNPNVMVEMGTARGVGKPLIIISQSPEDVPSERASPYILYTRSKDGLAALQRNIVGVLTSPMIEVSLLPTDDLRFASWNTITFELRNVGLGTAHNVKLEIGSEDEVIFEGSIIEVESLYPREGKSVSVQSLPSMSGPLHIKAIASWPDNRGSVVTLESSFHLLSVKSL